MYPTGGQTLLLSRSTGLKGLETSATSSHSRHLKNPPPRGSLKCILPLPIENSGTYTLIHLKADSPSRLALQVWLSGCPIRLKTRSMGLSAFSPYLLLGEGREKEPSLTRCSRTASLVGWDFYNLPVVWQCEAGTNSGIISTRERY